MNPATPSVPATDLASLARQTAREERAAINRFLAVEHQELKDL